MNQTTAEKIADDVEVADNFWKAFRGLMLKREFTKDEALLIVLPKPRRCIVHTFFVLFPIDIIYLDSNFRVVELHAGLKPWRIRRSEKVANYLLELPAGAIHRSRTEIGHRLLPKRKYKNVKNKQ